MKSVSKAALIAAAVIVAPMMAATPAAAQKKDEAPKLQTSEAFRKAAAEAQTALGSGDLVGAEAKIAATEAVAQNADEKYFAAALRFDLEGKKKNPVGRAAPLDTLIASGRVTGTQLGDFHFLRGQLYARDKKYGEALSHYAKARELGSTQPDLPLQYAIAQFETKDFRGGAASMDAAIKAEQAAGRKPPENWYQFTVNKFYQAGDKAMAADWLSRQLAVYPSPQAWRASLLIFMEQSGAKGVKLDADQRLDVLRLMRAAKALSGEAEYFEYADAASRRGLPWEVKSVIDEGRAAGKIPSGSAQINALYTKAVAGEKSGGPLSAEETRAKAAAKGDVAMQTADAYLASRNFAKAIELYRLSLQKGGVDTNLVNTRLGISLALAGQKAEAKTAFAAVSGDPRGEIARFWTTWVDGAATA